MAWWALPREECSCLPTATLFSHPPQLPSLFQLLVWEPALGYRHDYVALRKACGHLGRS